MSNRLPFCISVVLVALNHCSAAVVLPVTQLSPVTELGQYAEFGSSIELAAGLAVVGTQFDGPDSGGAVYLFEPTATDASAWLNTAKINLPDQDEEGGFGSAIALQGGTLFIGAQGTDFQGTRSGSVYVYGKDEASEVGWSQQQRLLASDGHRNASFGHSVAANGDTLFVGAPDHDPGHNGQVYVFQQSVGVERDWIEVGKLSPTGPGRDKFLGSAIDVSGDTLAVSAFGEGRVYIFDRNPHSASQWDLNQVIQPSERRYFGCRPYRP